MKRLIIILALLIPLGACRFDPTIDLTPVPQTSSASGVVVDAVTGEPVTDAFAAIGTARCEFTFEGFPSYAYPAGVRVGSDGGFHVQGSGTCLFRLRVWGDPDAPIDRLYSSAEVDLDRGKNDALRVRLAPLSRLSITFETQTPLGPDDRVFMWAYSGTEDKTVQFTGADSPPLEVLMTSIGDRSVQITWWVTRSGNKVKHSDTIATPAHQDVSYVVRY